MTIEFLLIFYDVKCEFVFELCVCVFSIFAQFFSSFCYFFNIMQLLLTLAETRTKGDDSPTFNIRQQWGVWHSGLTSY